MQQTTRRVHDCPLFQTLSALVIVATFVCNAAAAQIHRTASPGTLASLQRADAIFTVFFTVSPSSPPMPTAPCSSAVGLQGVRCVCMCMCVCVCVCVCVFVCVYGL